MSHLFNNRLIPALILCIFLGACGNDGTTKAGDSATKAGDNTGQSVAGGKGEVTKEDFQKIISNNRHVLVDFYADWCGPCKQMEPAIANITRQYEGRVVVYRINVDEAEELCNEMGVEAIPYLVFYKDGKIKNELEGYQREEVLKQNIETIFQ